VTGVLPGLPSARTTYAIRALADLALAAPRPVSGRDLAESNHIPPSYLYQVLANLRRGRLISSYRGHGGGFYLTRPAASITLADVIRTLGGPASGNVAFTAHHVSAGDHVARRLQKLWATAGNATMLILEGVSLADLIDGGGTPKIPID
jgi:Rrf2 family protein